MRILFKHDTSVELDDRQTQPGRRMTEREFVKWQMPGTRAEWADGEVIIMSPDSGKHISLVDFLATVVGLFARKRDLGRAFGANYQMRFSRLKRRRSADLVFVAKDRLDILKPNHIEGPPDLVVEIVSPESTARDWREKYLEYQRAGIKEYWIIEPTLHRMEAYTLIKREYVRIDERDGKIHSRVLPGLYIKPEWLWSDPACDPLEVLKELGAIG